MNNEVPYALIHLASPANGGASAYVTTEVEWVDQANAFDQRLSSSLSYVFVVGPDLPESLTADPGHVLILLRP